MAAKPSRQRKSSASLRLAVGKTLQPLAGTILSRNGHKCMARKPNETKTDEHMLVKLPKNRHHAQTIVVTHANLIMPARRPKNAT